MNIRVSPLSNRLPALVAVMVCTFAVGEEQEAPVPVGCGAEFDPAPAGYAFIREQNSYQVPGGGEVDRIHFTRHNIFDLSDPEQNRWLYRWANRLHVLTKEKTLAQQLLFRPGDSYEPRVVEESARLLRQNKYIFDAAIRPVSACGDRVDVEVITRDVWSFTPEFSVRRTGGKSTVRYSLRDTNILGSGKEMMIAGRNDVDRDSAEFMYRDTNLFGTRNSARVNLVDSDDGYTHEARASLPFYSLDAKRSWGVTLFEADQIDTQYFNANKVSEVRHETSVYQASFGFSRGLRSGVARRWRLGYRHEAHRFEPVGENLPPPAPFPVDRTLSYPFVTFESVEDEYAKNYNLDQIYRTEDLHLGLRLVNSVGYSPREGRRLIVRGALEDTLRYDRRNFLAHRLDWEGYWNFDRSAGEQALVAYGIRYHRRHTPKRAFFGMFEGAKVHHLSPERQLQLGGDTGLRGYPQRYATGDRSYLVTLEERFYTDVHVLQLVRVGWALFFDLGKAWWPGRDNGAGNRALMNAGFGIRLSSSKAELGRVLHLDFAYPMAMRSDPEVDGIQYLVTIKNSF